MNAFPKQYHPLLQQISRVWPQNDVGDYHSQQHAAVARDAGRLAKEIVPMTIAADPNDPQPHSKSQRHLRYGAIGVCIGSGHGAISVELWALGARALELPDVRAGGERY